MIERDVVLAGKHGLHARPAAEFVKLAGRFDSDVQLSKGDMTVDGKSIMGVMMLAAECGSTVTLRVKGPDEAAAAEALSAFLSSERPEE
ncbi:MAG: HPr family phosphocarrier protein [Candidatus Eisenbacteria bacterium]|nr:HPr family phosphocarrier protein [Candidatus Eisenbacteria bacterium]